MTAVDLGTLGGDGTTALDFNDRGQVVGVSDTPSGDGHAFRWQRGTMTDLTPWLRGYSVAVATNERGQVLLRWTETDTSREGTILWSRGAQTEIASSSPQALNEHGQVLFDGLSLWDDGTATSITSPDSSLEALATGLGDGGHVIGTLWRIPEPGGGHPPSVGGFVWHDGTSTRLDIQPYLGGEPIGVDATGRVLINARHPDGGRAALLWDDGEYVELGSLGSSPVEDTWAIDINDRGQIVGSSTTTSGDTHPFLWQDGEMIDLDTVTGRESGALAIGERGHVAGNYIRGEGPYAQSYGFLWWCGEMVDLGQGSYPHGSHVNARGQVVGSRPGSTSAPNAVMFTPVRR